MVGSFSPELLLSDDFSPCFGQSVSYDISNAEIIMQKKKIEKNILTMGITVAKKKMATIKVLLL